MVLHAAPPVEDGITRSHGGGTHPTDAGASTMETVWRREHACQIDEELPAQGAGNAIYVICHVCDMDSLRSDNGAIASAH